MSTGRQARVRVPPTTDRKKLKDAAGGLFSDGGATILSDTLLEIDDRFMRKAEDRWPVFVIVNTSNSLPEKMTALQGIKIQLSYRRQ